VEVQGKIYGFSRYSEGFVRGFGGLVRGLPNAWFQTLNFNQLNDLIVSFFFHAHPFAFKAPCSEAGAFVFGFSPVKGVSRRDFGVSCRCGVRVENFCHISLKFCSHGNSKYCLRIWFGIAINPRADNGSNTM